MANVYASYFSSTVQQQGYNFDGLSLYTFAAPASGNEDFASDLDNKITDAWHYANNNDIVPKFPVSSAILALAFLFIPSPSAGEITFTYKGLTISLREGLVILSGIFELGAYQQESNNYIPFTNPLDANYANNTMQDWFSQAAAQHAMNVYANYLDVTLTAKLDKESSIL
ncbi:hypothetical protein RYH73_09025 [Olivibacter sp. CPCC 100613]|uniref:lipase family protein n=1 Tax=Olivibacter sp. CPCC 100613 TaxID=3079931 RepID=UPI002FFD5497